MVTTATAANANFWRGIHMGEDVGVSGARTAVTNDSNTAWSRATILRHTKFRRQIEFQHRNPHFEA